MAFSRREFLQGAMTAFAGAAVPLSFIAKAAASDKEAGALEWTTFESAPHATYLVGLLGQRGWVSARSVCLRWPANGDLRQYPAEINFGLVHGMSAEFEVFYDTLTNIGNRAELLIGV